MSLPRLFKTKFKISTDYLIIFIIISLGVIAMSVASGFSTYRDNLNLHKKSLQEDAVITESLITDVINEHSWQLRTLADKIMKSDGDLKRIDQIITSYNTLNVKSNFEQFLNQKTLYWADKNDNLVIKNKIGVLEYPKKLPEEYRVAGSRENAWQLRIAREFPYFKNDYNVIFTSFGVTNPEGEYLGSLISSIDISIIQNLINKELSSNSSNIVILNSDTNKIVIQSNSNDIIDNSEFFTYKLGNINYEKNNKGSLSDQIIENNIKYISYEKLVDRPFIIVSGYNLSLYKSQLLRLLFKKIYPNIIIGFVLLLALFLFYKRIVKPIGELSAIARGFSKNIYSNHFPRKISSPEIYDLSKALLRVKFQSKSLEKSHIKLVKTKESLEEAVETIEKSDIAQIEILKQVRREISNNTSQATYIINMLKHNLANASAEDSELNLLLIKNLEQEIINITEFATDELNKDDHNICDILDQVALSQAKELQIKKIKLTLNYDNNLPSRVFVDKIRLTQILSSVLNKTLRLLEQDNQITIDVKTVIRNKKKQLSIQIKDNGIGIGFKDHIKRIETLGGEKEGSISGINISVDTIEELIKLHDGTITYNNKIQQGSIADIIIPYKRPLRIKNSSPTQRKRKDNIIYLSSVRKDA